MRTYILIGHCLVIDSAVLARQIADVASDSFATDIQVLDIREISSIADCFVIGTADNIRQLRAMGESIERKLREDGVRPERREGTAEAGWLVLDYNGVIVHLFSSDQRSHYRLEELWSDAQRLLVIQ